MGDKAAKPPPPAKPEPDDLRKAYEKALRELADSEGVSVEETRRRIEGSYPRPKK